MDWKVKSFVDYLKSTAAGKIKYHQLHQGTVHWMFGPDKKSWSEKTMHAVQSEKAHCTITKPLGQPWMLVCTLFLIFSFCSFLFLQANHPDIINAIDTQLQALCGAGVPLSGPVI